MKPCLVFLLALLFFGCMSQHSPEITRAISNCSLLEDVDMRGEHGHGYFIYPKEECIYSLALEYNDSSICSEFEETERIYPLSPGLAVYLGQTEIAGKFSRDYCMDKYARKRLDLSACNKITDANMEKNCDLSVILRVGDPNLCFDASNSLSPEDCIVHLARIFYDPSLCNRLGSEQSIKECQEQWRLHNISNNLTITRQSK